MRSKFKPKNLKLEDYDYDGWITVEELDDEELDDMPPVETDEDVKEGKRLKTWTPNKLLITLSTLLAQKKLDTIHTNHKRKSETYCIFCISIIKLPKKFTTNQSSHHNNGRKYDCNKKSQI